MKKSVDNDLRKRFDLPRTGPRAAVYGLVMRPAFEVGVLLCIVLNALAMATYHADQGVGFEQVRERCNALFTYVFLAEAALKLFAFHPRCYVSDSWNVFDGVIVAVRCGGVT